MNIYRDRSFLLAGLLVVIATCIVFQIRFGWQLLEISNFRWLMVWGSDRTPDFLAWEFYRNTPWQFPLGKIENYSWPNITSTGLTGSIPLLALPFKALDPLMPEVVQYFGIWLFSCYLLQGLTALLLLRTFDIKNAGLLALGASLFVLSPVLLHRFDHMNLCCHWIILISFWIYYKQSIKHSATFFWHLLPVGISGLSHPYLIVITIPMALASFWKEWRITKTISTGQALFYSISQILFVLGLWALNGNFILESGSEKGAGFGYFSANLNTFLNSLDKTLLLPGLPIAKEGQYEGFAYLGAGMLFILLVLLLLRIKNKGLIYIPRIGGPLLWSVIALGIFSLSNKITFFGMLARIPIPDFLESLGATFRATGRYIWPLYYLINLAILLALLKAKIPSALKWTVLILAITLQATDISPLLDRQYVKHEPYDPPINRELWQKAAQEADKFIMYPPYIRDYHQTGDFMFFAHEAFLAKIPITAGHLARFDQSKRDSFKNVLNTKLDQGELGTFENGVIISTVDRIDRFIPMALDQQVKLFQVDHYLLVIPNRLSHLESFFLERSTEKPDTLLREKAYQFLDRHAAHTVFMVLKGGRSVEQCDSLVKYMNSRGAEVKDLDDRGAYMAILNKNEVIFEKLHENKFLFHTFAKGSQVGSLTMVHDLYLESSGNPSKKRGKIKISGREYSFQQDGLNLVAVDDQFQIREMTFFPLQDDCEQWRLYQAH